MKQITKEQQVVYDKIIFVKNNCLYRADQISCEPSGTGVNVKTSFMTSAFLETLHDEGLSYYIDKDGLNVYE